MKINAKAQRGKGAEQSDGSRCAWQSRRHLTLTLSPERRGKTARPSGEEEPREGTRPTTKAGRRAKPLPYGRGSESTVPCCAVVGLSQLCQVSPMRRMASR